MLFLNGQLTDAECAMFLQKTMEAQTCQLCGGVTVCVNAPMVVYALHCLMMSAHMGLRLKPRVSSDDLAELVNNLKRATEAVYGASGSARYTSDATLPASL